MAVLLITYDLNRPGQDYADVHTIIKSYAYVKLSESSYAIETSATPSVIFQRLKPYLDSNDTLYVITLTRPWDGRGPKEVNDWLSQRLGP